MSKLTEISDLLRKKIDDLEDKVEGMKKLKPAEKGDLANKYEKQCKIPRNLLQTYQFTIQDCQDDPTIASHQSQYKQYKNRLEKIQNGIQFNRTAGVSQEQLFKHRNPVEKYNKNNERKQMIQKGHQLQKQGKNALQNALKNVNQMDQIANDINIELNRQIQQLDKMYDNLKDTDTTLKRAQKHLRYFAKQIYTDRLMICLIVVIILAIIIIIILSAMGKTPKAQIDKIN